MFEKYDVKASLDKNASQPSLAYLALNDVNASHRKLKFFLKAIMGTSIHTLQTLFCQLGLADDEEQVNTFIALHRPLPNNIQLTEAFIWNAAQPAFLAEAIKDDSEWCESVDTLDCLLRGN